MLECFKDFRLALEKVKCLVICKVVNKGNIAGFSTLRLLREESHV
jgi:hypothetical protein